MINQFRGVLEIKFYSIFQQTAVVMKMKWSLGRQAKAQGIGLHTRDEIRAIGIADLEAISAWLGEKLFMMGPLPCVLGLILYNFSCS